MHSHKIGCSNTVSYILLVKKLYSVLNFLSEYKTLLLHLVLSDFMWLKMHFETSDKKRLKSNLSDNTSNQRRDYYLLVYSA